jgi:hypothetical protein
MLPNQRYVQVSYEVWGTEKDTFLNFHVLSSFRDIPIDQTIIGKYLVLDSEVDALQQFCKKQSGKKD